jgi:pyridoxal phosphate enzyme (YggS family)
MSAAGNSRAASRLIENLAAVRGRIAEAARTAGRDPGEVRLIAVSKYVDADTTRALADAGCHDLGEARPQSLWSKAEALAGLDVTWHLIGHLQRNKIERTLPLVQLIHSVDSERLLRGIDEQATTIGRVARVLLEVNVSGESAKHGFAPAELPAALETAATLASIRVDGLMGMAGLEGGAAAAECDFAALRELRDRLDGAKPAGVSLAELSMGMSGDFEIAIRHGSTMVRVGSALFEGIDN